MSQAWGKPWQLVRKQSVAKCKADTWFTNEYHDDGPSLMHTGRVDVVLIQSDLLNYYLFALTD